MNRAKDAQSAIVRRNTVMFKQYDEIILQYILNRAGGVLKPPTGDLKYPYIDPGAG